MHAEKRESLGGEITCGHCPIRNCFVQQGIEPYINKVSSPICIVFHRYRFTRIFGGTTSGITALMVVNSAYLSFQISSIQFRTFCTFLTVMLIKIFVLVGSLIWQAKLDQITPFNVFSIHFVYVSIPCCTKRLRNWPHVISLPRPSRFSACITEKLGVAWRLHFYAWIPAICMLYA